MLGIVSALIKPQEENLPTFVSIEDGCTQFADFFSNTIKRLLMLLLFAFQSMFISIWVSRLEIAEFPDSVRRSAP